MSMEFTFAVVPFKYDGRVIDLFHQTSTAYELKGDVYKLETEGEELLPYPYRLSLDVADVENINNETGGAFLQFTDGILNQRYIMLECRQEMLNKLRAAIPAIDNEFWHKFLKIFVRNCDATLKRFGNRAAIIIL